MSEDTAAKYKAWGWNVLTCNGNDADEIRQALIEANKETSRPTIIIGKTIMGKGALRADGTSYEACINTHGAPLGGDAYVNTIKNLGGDTENPFQIFPEVAALYAARKEELKKIVRVIKKVSPDMPHDMWLVIDGNTGQNTINQTKIFNQSFPLTGLVVTKLDGTARGGSVLSIASSLQIPIRWVGMGERIDQLVEFNKRDYVDGLFENALENRE
jgi:hypothetical protein